jgi:formylglycine-generating enzyme required for sulfatase activity
VNQDRKQPEPQDAGGSLPDAARPSVNSEIPPATAEGWKRLYEDYLVRHVGQEVSRRFRFGVLLYLGLLTVGGLVSVKALTELATARAEARLEITEELAKDTKKEFDILSEQVEKSKAEFDAMVDAQKAEAQKLRADMQVYRGEAEEFLHLATALADMAVEADVARVGGSILRSLAAWDAASSATRKTIAERVPKRTGGFEFMGLVTFRAGGQTHETALFTHERTKMEFALIPGGSFLMGSSKWDIARYLLTQEGPQHQVTLTRPFLISRTEVTQAVWKRVMGTDPSTHKGDDRPVERVSSDDATEFCRETGLALPTEAQWEYACRAGTTTLFASGRSEADLERTGWFSEISGFQTHPVRGKEPNAFGLYDMHGNVWEWCEDTYHKSYDGAPRDGSAWIDGGSSDRRMTRGGGYDSRSGLCRSSCRWDWRRSNRYKVVGFRPVFTLPSED